MKLRSAVGHWECSVAYRILNKRGYKMIDSLISLDLPVDIATCSIYENDSFIYLFGGKYKFYRNKKKYYYISDEIIRIPKIDYGSWIIIDYVLPIPLAQSQVYFNGTSLYLFGGTNYQPTDTICRAAIVDPEVWYLLTDTLPQPAKNLSLKEWDEFIYLLDSDNNCIYGASKNDPERWRII